MILDKLFLICSFISVFCVAQKKEIQVVLLAGQSNMAGHGNYDTLDAETKQRIEKVAHRVWLSTSIKSTIAPKPLSFYVSTSQSEKYDFTKHFGPELLIGLTLAEAHPNEQFLLIKTAVGGTSLYGAWNPNWTQEKANIAERGAERKSLHLYRTHLIHFQKELNRLKSEGQPYKIIGMVWMQGESDTNKEITASNYQKNLENLITGYRKEVSLPNLPVVIGQVNPLPRKFKQGPGLVRKAMTNIADYDKNIVVVKTSTDPLWKDYPKHTDNLHYNTEGQKRLGIAFGKALIDLQN
ncbi:sialate O-acetylesterase [Wenyingzhuangia sp. 2_MG-2023]|nr:sialate O-acetylesterase [Wenyingzhuangia sp. 2_MG-2023]